MSICCALLALAACAPSGDGATHPVSYAPTPSADTAPSDERFYLIAPATGHEHQLDLFRPSVPSSNEGSPVVIFLDGNRVSRAIRAALAAGARLESVYVTVGYRDTEDHAVQARALDYTPAVEVGTHSPDPLDGTRRNGGAEDFRRFLDEHVKPEVSRRALVDWRRSTLWGHSYGGLFVLTTMLDAPGAYARYVAVDPSLWWRDALVYTRLMRESPPEQPALVLLRANPGLEPDTRVRDPARVALRQRLYAALPEDAYERIATRWHATYRYYPEHHHGSLFEQSLSELLGAAR